MEPSGFGRSRRRLGLRRGWPMSSGSRLTWLRVAWSSSHPPRSSRPLRHLRGLSLRGLTVPRVAGRASRFDLAKSCKPGGLPFSRLPVHVGRFSRFAFSGSLATAERRGRHPVGRQGREPLHALQAQMGAIPPHVRKLSAPRSRDLPSFGLECWLLQR